MREDGTVVRALFTCSGLGVMNRGIESFFRDAFDGLKSVPGLELQLLKGAGAVTNGEHVMWQIPRTCGLAGFLGRVAGRNGYVIEQWSCLPSAIRHLRRFRPQVVFYSDANLGFLLFWLRRATGVPYKLLFSNGGPVHPPFIRTDYVHQVAPCHYQEALSAGEPPGKHFLVPYGINLIPKPAVVGTEALKALRRNLELPTDRPVILSVGWIGRFHKRMDYVIEEIARLPEPRPFLQMLGAVDEGSEEILALGRQLLGPNNFAANSVPYEQVFQFYRAADCFVLASLQEGFGRVYLEALMHGLPVIAHRNSLTEFVLGSEAVLEDLTRPGALAASLDRVLRNPELSATAAQRWRFVRDRFSWGVLAPSYREMFRWCAQAHRTDARCRSDFSIS